MLLNRAVPLLVTLCGLAAWNSAHAEDEIALEDARLVFGAPGELNIETDLTDGMIGAPAIPREFTDYDALAAFLEDELNAVVLWDEDGAYAGYELVTHISGETFYLAPGSMEPVETDHPELVILGGVTGYVIVGEHAICVDPSKCNPDVPATSAQVQASQLAESIAPWRRWAG